MMVVFPAMSQRLLVPGFNKSESDWLPSNGVNESIMKTND